MLFSKNGKERKKAGFTGMVTLPDKKLHSRTAQNTGNLRRANGCAMEKCSKTDEKPLDKIYKNYNGNIESVDIDNNLLLC